MFTKSQQAAAVMVVLNSMKDCIDNNDTYSTSQGVNFNLCRQSGICWHVYAYTPNSEESGIGLKFLEPVFEQMGLDTMYPVERQIVKTEIEAEKLYWEGGSLYSGKRGDYRRELLTKLIAHFEKDLVDNQ